MSSKLAEWGKPVFAGILALVLVIASPVESARAEASVEEATKTVFITGSNRGIGIGFVKHYSEAGWRVIATARAPDRADELNSLAAERSNIIVEQLDVTDHKGIEALAKKYEGQAIDLLINNAGMKPANTDPEVDYKRARTMFEVNTFGPVKIFESFYPHVKSSGEKKVVNISSVIGSIGGGPAMPFMHNYRASKAALNAYMRGLSYGTKDDGVIVVLMHPGRVDVSGKTACQEDGGAPAGQYASLCVRDSISMMAQTIGSLDMEDNGEFFNVTPGQQLPW